LAEVVTCGHCNAKKRNGAKGWKQELGLDFCPNCKDSYWHTDEVWPPAEETAVPLAGGSAAPLQQA